MSYMIGDNVQYVGRVIAGDRANTRIPGAWSLLSLPDGYIGVVEYVEAGTHMTRYQVRFAKEVDYTPYKVILHLTEFMYDFEVEKI